MNIDSLTYGSILSRIQEIQNIQKTDINSCSMYQLTSVPGLGQQYAERIMKYRRDIGPLSRKSLIQIGLPEREIDRLMPYITGLTPDEADPKINYLSRERYEKAQKEIFKRFIGLGLPAASALDLADMAMKGQQEACAVRITSQPGLDARKKKKALELCVGPQ
jgi:Helix-hairpin-helix motif